MIPTLIEVTMVSDWGNDYNVSNNNYIYQYHNKA